METDPGVDRERTTKPYRHPDPGVVSCDRNKQVCGHVVVTPGEERSERK